MKTFSYLILLGLMISFLSCKKTEDQSILSAANDASDIILETQRFNERLKSHLDAVSNKDLIALKKTMSPEGNMQLLLTGSEIISSVDSFIRFHEEWFQDTSWTFDTKILNSDVGRDMGLATVETIYKEPDRGGKPYFNRMKISYVLKKYNDEWCVISDHATSIEKTGDKK